MSLVDAKGVVGDITGIAKNSTLALVEYPKNCLKRQVLNLKYQPVQQINHKISLHFYKL